MKQPRLHRFRLGITPFASLLLAFNLAVAEGATGRKYMVATVRPEATSAALAAFQCGGNAVDAAVAAALTLGVVDGYNSGLGGGCLILIRLADGELVAIDGREKAPAGAARAMYLRDGRLDRSLSVTGPLAVGVPGALKAYSMAIEHHGRIHLAELLRSAAEIAESGFEIDAVYADKLRNNAEDLARFEGSRNVFLKPDGSTYLAGETLKQPDLAHSYRQIAELGTDWFYRGPFAEQIGDWMSAHGGILTAADFADYEAKRRTPIETRFRDYTIVGFPPPSSGGIHVAQILNIIDNFDLNALRRQDSSLPTHVMAEAMKLGFADRSHWLGDSDYVAVPRGLIDPGYAKQLAARIQLDKALDVQGHGLPPNWQTDTFEKHTTHIAAADDQGNWVAITATINTSFGSRVVVPGTGVLLNNEMDDFSIQPGVPNAFGLVGDENNAIAPGKRPLSSMSPTIVLNSDGEPILTVGAAGGPKIVTQVVSTIVNHLDLGMELADAVAEPRFHHQWLPDRVQVESSVPTTILESLRSRGHDIEVSANVGVTQAISGNADGAFIGVHDPRIPGKAAGH